MPIQLTVAGKMSHNRNTMKKPLRAIFHGMRHEHAPPKLLETLPKLKDDFEVVAVVDDLASTTPTWHARRPTGEGLRLVTAEEALAMPDIDVVFVETANADLVATALPWAERGVAMHLDKPTGEAREPFRELVALCRAKNVPLQLGYMFRANPGIQFLHKIVREGLLGDIIHVEANMDHNYGDDAYQAYVSTFKGGILYNLCCHLIDFIVPLMDGDLVRASTCIGTAAGDPPDSRNRCSSLLEWKTSTAFVHSCSRIARQARRLRVDGTKGTFEMPVIERFDKKPLMAELSLAKPAGGYQAGPNEINLGITTDRYADQLLELAAIVRGEKPNPTDLYDHDLRVHDVLLQMCGITA